MTEHRFFRESVHGCCAACLVCRTCEPDRAQAPCTRSTDWICEPAEPEPTD